MCLSRAARTTHQKFLVPWLEVVRQPTTGELKRDPAERDALLEDKVGAEKWQNVLGAHAFERCVGLAVTLAVVKVRVLG